MKKLHIFLAATLIISACKGKQETEKTEAFRMNEKMREMCPVGDVKKEKLLTEMRLFGKVEPDNNKQAQVYSILGGNVESIHVELGDYVKKGQLLAVIKSTEVAEFQKERLDARSSLSVAEKNLQVARDLYSGKLNSERDVKVAEEAVAEARNELERINEVYGIYQLKGGSRFNIVAPINGFIIQKDINQNELLRPDKADVLFSIAEINEVWVMANVNESDISKVQLGFDAEVSTLSFPDEKYKGKIDKIFNVIDPQTKAMKVRVRIPNANFKLKPDMSATVMVRNQENREMIAVPSASVIFDKNKNWVMVYKSDNNIETRRVEIHSVVGDMTFIRFGLKEGEKIIVKNGLFIYDALND